MKFFHISHTDMDGYGCQLISKKIFPDGYFLNANYGIEVKFCVKDVLNKISKCERGEKILFIISDLNLSAEESKDLDKKINDLLQFKMDIKKQLKFL